VRPSPRLGLTIALVGSVVVRVVQAEPLQARPPITVEAVLPGCRSLVATEGVPTSSEAGFCSGLIDGLLYLGSMVPMDFCFVVPFEIPHNRVVAAIVDEIEAIYPSVRQQHFRALAIEVLEFKWPCHVQPQTLGRE
jgi:hypothetical protein